MGRGQVRDSRAMGEPSGPAWSAFRRVLFGEWGSRPKCFACGCQVDGPDRGEVEHRISTSLRPDLAWTRWWQGEPFLVPVHGSGRKRCPACDLACNLVIGSNAARRDELGRSVPLTPAEITAAQQRTRGRGRSSTGRDRRDSPPEPAKMPGSPPEPRVFPAAGRAWLNHLTGRQDVDGGRVPG